MIGKKGIAEVKFDDKTVATGEFSNGMFNGKVKIILPSGDVYEG